MVRSAFIAFNGLPTVGDSVGVPPTDVKEANNVGGNDFGISKPRSFKFMSLQAMLNSMIFILPSESVSARDLNG